MLPPLPAQIDAERAPHRPAGHRPHAPAWTAVLCGRQQTIVYSQLGVQHPGAEPSLAGLKLLQALRTLLSGPCGPAVLDFAVEIDDGGHRNDLLLAYWTSAVEERRWRARDDVARLWTSELADGVGLWREALTIAADRLETLYSTDRGAQGVSSFAAVAPTTVHEYDGAARDRIARSRVDALQRVAMIPRNEPSGSGERVLRPRSPENICFIRTAQDWSRCGGEEREIYLGHVAPALERGARFLRHHPAETGCLSGRFVRELDPDGAPAERTCFLGYFASLGDLERWTWSHETHAAIFGSFMDLVAQRGGEIALALWHEVCVLPSESVELEYRNCHPQTGLVAQLTGAPTASA
ncbi:MAG TPA: phenylacetaldoxime dehydratase family protein [Solirubrobacteraceae bacterium]|nr:phenylacetaldoxime dehydratase family protein [Solirubrobacteraceae bacterium]